MKKSATQTVQEDYQRNQSETRLHFMHKTFAEKYAPADPRERDVFHADLAMLLRQTHIDAQEPFTTAAAIQIAKTPMPPLVIKRDTEV